MRVMDTDIEWDVDVIVREILRLRRDIAFALTIIFFEILFSLMLFAVTLIK